MQNPLPMGEVEGDVPVGGKWVTTLWFHPSYKEPLAALRTRLGAAGFTSSGSQLFRSSAPRNWYSTFNPQYLCMVIKPIQSVISGTPEVASLLALLSPESLFVFPFLPAFDWSPDLWEKSSMSSTPVGRAPRARDFRSAWPFLGFKCLR